MNPQVEELPELLELPELPEETETIVAPPVDITAIEALHQDVIVCRDILTVMLALLVAYTFAKVALGWFHNV